MADSHPIAYALTAALESRRLTTVFQPIWKANGECWGFEALSRFPNGSPPDAVWALAYRQGLAARLDRLALTVAVETSQAIKGCLFLNVSPSCFQEVEFLAQLGDPDHIVWELTESDTLCGKDIEGLRQLQARGYSIAMDDAGSGYSTLERLDTVQPNIVKVDRPLVNAWARGEVAPLRRWVQAAQRIGAIVVAEGVEESRWVVPLADEGVQAMQGYALGGPMKAEHWVDRIESEYSPNSGGGGISTIFARK
ncbi:MAG: EAL domain-containing protein [Sulfobacillus acidophilus]|uniref:EAL domain-containing protein n=1 Tax=Sulfobacillus acidophilus TaxID=53633 RepID=A0A2T2WJ13_9FIRM|nr:MAG: EAL domain-containing protein [Sulfobacillus acidophilus]